MSQTRDINVVSTLTRKREEIERRIEAYREAIAQCERDLAAVTTTIGMYAKDGYYRPNMSLTRLFRRGEVFRLATAALEAAGKPLDTRELALVIGEAKGLDIGDKVIRKALASNIINTLTQRAKRGHLIRNGYRNGVAVWATKL
jgi:hypothetical protein